MNKHRIGYIFACLIPVACGAEAGFDPLTEGQLQKEETQSQANTEMSPERDSVLAEKRVLHTVEAGGETIEIAKYKSADGQESIMMREEGSAYQQPLLEALMESHGPLTTLETLYAIAPHIKSPARELVDAQGIEAEALGRLSTDVLRVNFDIEAAVEKSFSTTACDTAAYPDKTNYYWDLKGSRNSVSGFTFTCLNNDCATMTTGYTISRICNDADTTVKERNAWDFDTASPWNVTAWTNVPVGSSVGWYMTAGASRRYSADGDSAAGKKYHARAGVHYRLPIIR